MPSGSRFRLEQSRTSIHFAAWILRIQLWISAGHRCAPSCHRNVHVLQWWRRLIGNKSGIHCVPPADVGGSCRGVHYASFSFRRRNTLLKRVAPWGLFPWPVCDLFLAKVCCLVTKGVPIYIGIGNISILALFSISAYRLSVNIFSADIWNNLMWQYRQYWHIGNHQYRHIGILCLILIPTSFL